jgi:hypothetical protein
VKSASNWPPVDDAILRESALRDQRLLRLLLDSTYGVRSQSPQPSQPGLYADNPNWCYPLVWEPELRPWVRRETRCMQRLGATHCSLESGHGGLHHSEKVGVWWSDSE